MNLEHLDSHLLPLVHADADALPQLREHRTRVINNGEPITSYRLLQIHVKVDVVLEHHASAM